MLLGGWSLQAQQIGINTNNPDPSAALDVVSSDKGMLIPRLPSKTRLAIANPATSLLVFDTDSTLFYYFDGTQWQVISSTATEVWLTKYRAVYTQMGNVGVGTDSVLALFHLHSDTIAPEIRWSTPQFNVIVGLDETDGTIYVGRDSSGTLTKQFTIDTAGNVGIGTINPEENLHIYSFGSKAGIKWETLSFGGIVGLDETDGTISVGHVDGGVWDRTLMIDTAGNVGIGYIDLYHRFTVEGDIKTTSITLDDNTNSYTIELDDQGVPDLTKSTNNFVDLYHTNSQSFTNSTIDVTWGGQRFALPTGSAFTHTANSSELTVNREGYYKFVYMLSFDVTGGAPDSEIQSYISLKPSGGSFAPVSGSYSWISTGFSITASRNSTSKTIILWLDAGDSIKVNVERTAGNGTVSTLPEGCSLVVERL